MSNELVHEVILVEAAARSNAEEIKSDYLPTYSALFDQNSRISKLSISLLIFFWGYYVIILYSLPGQPPNYDELFERRKRNQKCREFRKKACRLLKHALLNLSSVYLVLSITVLIYDIIRVLFYSFSCTTSQMTYKSIWLILFELIILYFHFIFLVVVIYLKYK